MTPLPAAWLLVYPSGLAPVAPVSVTRADRCPDCGRIAMGSAEHWDGKRWQTRAACCGAERDELGCRAGGVA